MRCVDIYIFQTGVNVLYPFAFMQKAYRIGINGFVFQKNNDLFIKAEGDEKKIEEFIDFCEHCQFLIQEDYVEIEESEVQNYTSFEIIDKEINLPTPIKIKEKGDD